MAVIKLRAGGETHRGHIRETNQDVILVEPDLGLYAVLDGMGGAKAGDVAARIAGEEIAASIRRMSRIRRRSPRQALDLALHSAAVEVFMAAEKQLVYRGMGTTVVACLVVEPTHVVIGHAGDSRAYLLRDGKLGALTRDHTVAERLVDAGALRVDQVESCPQKHFLTRNLGREYGVQPDVLDLELKQVDRLLLCSDGLYGGASVGSIQRVLGSREAPTRVARARPGGADPLARRGGRLATHVLSGGVAGREVEAQEPRRADLVLLDVIELADARGRLGGLLDRREALADPGAELTRGHRVGQQEHRRALHELLDHGGLDAAARVEQAHPAAVAGDQRALGGRQRDVEVALRVLAVDPDRAGEAEWHLGHPGEVLDVAGDEGRRDRVHADVAQLDAGMVAGERAPPGGLGLGVVVDLVAGDAIWLGGHHASSFGAGARAYRSSMR